MMIEEDLSNRARFNAFKDGVRSLFNKVVSDVAKAEAKAGDVPLIHDKLERIHSRYNRALDYLRRPEGEVPAQEEVTMDLLVEWSGAQILRVCPEIVDETDPDTQDEVSGMLIGAESVLEELRGGPLDALAKVNNQGIKDMYHLTDEQCDLYNALDAAETVLEIYTEYT